MLDLFGLLKTGQSSAQFCWELKCRKGWGEAGSDSALLYLGERELEECSSVKKNHIIYSLLLVRALVYTGVLKSPSFLAVAAFSEPDCFGAGVRAHERMPLPPSSLFAV